MAAEPTWLSEARKSAEDAFGRLGWPRTSDEAWHYTSVAQQWGKGQAAPGSAADPIARALPIDGPRLVFVDGRYAAELSTPLPGTLVAISGALAADARAHQRDLGGLALDPAHGVVALNAARFSDGALIRVPRRTALDRPLVLVFASTGATTHVRSRVELEAESSADLVELHLGGPGSSTSAMTDVVLGPGAELRYTRVQDEPDTAVHLGRVEVRHHDDSKLFATSLILEGKLQRTEVVVHLAERAECNLDGFAVAHADHVADHYTLVRHATNRGTSRQTYKAIAADRGTSTFYGKVQVEAKTAGNDARQSSKNLLLSAGATANTRPQLEIDAEDVKCSHGATVGRLDEQQVFYLRSRGVAHADARALLIAAFAGEVLERIGHAGVREALAPRVAEKIATVASRGAQP